MSGGKLLTPSELVDHMKRKGITFNIVSEEDAIHFLTDHTYYTKLGSYRKNYSKHPDGPHKGEYTHLDFAYLVELSTIDMRLRYTIMEMSLDIEHALKIALINDILNNPKEDGYHITTKFMNSSPELSDKTERKVNESYCRELYHNNKDSLPIWVLFEVVSFGDLIRFYKYYYQVYPERTPVINKSVLDNVRRIRNASAHSNCLIHDINIRVDPHSFISKHLETVSSISGSMRKKFLRKRFTLDFTALLIAHKTLVKSEKAYAITKKKLRDLLFRRMPRHREYFKRNDTISSAYRFCFLLIRDYY